MFHQVIEKIHELVDREQRVEGQGAAGQDRPETPEDVTVERGPEYQEERQQDQADEQERHWK